MSFENSGEVKKYQILLVEDNIDNIELANEILTEEGYIVHIAKNGITALDYLEKNPNPDLILLDIAMPEMDGFQACIRIKDNEKTAEIPIIYLSALNDTANIVKGFELGAVDYVFKPFNFYELLSRVRTHIELKENRDKLQNMNKYLEKVVEERTYELRKAYQKLEHLDKAKTDFLSLISHELRTPLNGIMGYFSLLNEMDYDNFVIDDNFKVSVDDLIKKLLRFSDLSILFTELRSAYYASKKQEIGIFQSITSLMEPYIEDIEKNQLDVVIDVNENETLVSDKFLFNNCLEIIINNAIKFSPPEGKLLISTTKDQDYTSIAIVDDGPGFTEKAKEFLFDIFETDNFSNTYSGFGLGMSTLKLIIDFLEGKVETGNTVGGGAVVKLYFKNLKD